MSNGFPQIIYSVIGTALQRILAGYAVRKYRRAAMWHVVEAALGWAVAHAEAVVNERLHAGCFDEAEGARAVHQRLIDFAESKAFYRIRDELVETGVGEGDPGIHDLGARVGNMIGRVKELSEPLPSHLTATDHEQLRDEHRELSRELRGLLQMLEQKKDDLAKLGMLPAEPRAATVTPKRRRPRSS